MGLYNGKSRLQHKFQKKVFFEQPYCVSHTTPTQKLFCLVSVQQCFSKISISKNDIILSVQKHYSIVL